MLEVWKGRLCCTSKDQTEKTFCRGRYGETDRLVVLEKVFLACRQSFDEKRRVWPGLAARSRGELRWQDSKPVWTTKAVDYMTEIVNGSEICEAMMVQKAFGELLTVFGGADLTHCTIHGIVEKVAVAPVWDRLRLVPTSLDLCSSRLEIRGGPSGV